MPALIFTPAAATTPVRSRWGRFNNGVFYAIHLGCLGAAFSGVSAKWAAIAAGSYCVRMFAITAGYHRFFSHCSYRTSRVFRFLLGWLGAAAAQRGPLWWAAHHRNHHRYSDTERDIHSPRHGGLWWAHAGWILSPHFAKTDADAVKDLARWPELRWLERNHWLPPVLLAAACAAAGGLEGFSVGFCLSTTLLYHGTFTVNSLAHVWGSAPYAVGDDSRNNPWLAAITLGEGWHNNHHRYPASERQGFTLRQIDVSHIILRALAACGLVWDLREPPRQIVAEGYR